MGCYPSTQQMYEEDARRAFQVPDVEPYENARYRQPQPQPYHYYAEPYEPYPYGRAPSDYRSPSTPRYSTQADPPVPSSAAYWRPEESRPYNNQVSQKQAYSRHDTQNQVSTGVRRSSGNAYQVSQPRAPNPYSGNNQVSAPYQRATPGYTGYENQVSQPYRR
ncbi:uncharacterized protein LTR77_008503 [Saxophila tyrrhenica]|uniref:Uncharacterized protein n=1 Tax=Saxophila tyrrhenica TaxID=1690608 RepID=A0AAV9P429_9PEZI|nr:hypothetical protein LTR77_008503 [Saxophila tyrrhenica]